jgi:sugar phosphate isomerase/epimerase
MNRRNLLSAGAAAAGTALLDCMPSRSRAAECRGPAAGVQLFTVRDQLASDPRATLAALREIGLVEAELYGLSGNEGGRFFGLDAAELRRTFEDNGIRVELSQIDGALENSGAIAASAHALGVSTVIVGLPAELGGVRDGRFTVVPVQGRSQLDGLADKLNRVGREYRALGLSFGYHNHQVEFMPVDGVLPYDYLVSRTDPELVKLELDVGWVALAGADPVAYLRRHAGRVVACHLKDYREGAATDMPERNLVEPGAGTVDFGAVLAAMRDTNVSHGLIEIDESEDPLGAVERGHRHLQSLKACDE